MHSAWDLLEQIEVSIRIILFLAREKHIHPKKCPTVTEIDMGQYYWLGARDGGTRLRREERAPSTHLTICFV